MLLPESSNPCLVCQTHSMRVFVLDLEVGGKCIPKQVRVCLIVDHIPVSVKIIIASITALQTSIISIREMSKIQGAV